MGKSATRSKRMTTNDPAQDYLAGFEAKQRFVGTVLNMGWRLAITFLVPIIIGAWLDKRFDAEPSYTITGLFIAIAASVMVVSSTVKEVNAESAAMEKKPKRGKNA